MSGTHRTHLASLGLAALACPLALALAALAGCGLLAPFKGMAPPAGTAPSTSAAPAKPAEYASLVTIADVTRITGASKVTTMEPGERAGDSPYYVLFTAPDRPELVSFRVAKPDWYDEELKLLKGTETRLTIGGHEAYSYSSRAMDESGVVVRMPSTDYAVVTRWLFKTPEGAPQLTDAQLTQIAELAVSRSQ